MSSIDYYDQNAEAFFARTIQVDMHQRYAKFLPHLHPDARILDAGCGSGRDSLHFKNLGFEVVAMDASIEMVNLSSHLLVLGQLSFDQLGCVKDPGLNDRKRVHIDNIDPFTIVQPRELSR